MKSFKGFTQSLHEATFARLVKKMEQQPIGVITAFRSCRSKEVNRKRNKALEGDLRAAGIQHYKALGRYIEGFKTDKEIPVDEEVFIVFYPKAKDGDSEELLKVLKRLGYKYNQDSILFKPAGDSEGYLYRTQDEDRDCEVGTPIDWPSKDGTPMGKFRIRHTQFETAFHNKLFSFVNAKSDDKKG